MNCSMNLCQFIISFKTTKLIPHGIRKLTKKLKKQMVEIVTSRVEKGNLNLKPKLKPKFKNIRKVQQLNAAAVDVAAAAAAVPVPLPQPVPVPVTAAVNVEVDLAMAQEVETAIYEPAILDAVQSTPHCDVPDSSAALKVNATRILAPVSFSSSSIVSTTLLDINTGDQTSTSNPKDAASVPHAQDPAEIPEIIDISTATMSELIRHPFTQGKLSAREEARLAEKKLKRTMKKEISGAEDVAGPAVVAIPPVAAQRAIPKLILVNGEMVVDQQSLQINAPVDELDMDNGDIIDEDAVNRYVTSASFRNRTRTVAPKWSAAMTERFYMGLSYFGTDFKSISYMFPGLTHRHIKLKHKAEETNNSAKITQYLRNRLKAPEELRKRILASVVTKQKLENSYYVGRKDDVPGRAPAKQESTEEVGPDDGPKVAIDLKPYPALELNLNLEEAAPLPPRKKREVVEPVVVEVKRGKVDASAVKVTARRRKKKVDGDL